MTDIDIDISDALAPDIKGRVRVTVHLPDRDLYPNPSVVCFAFPGAGYGRKYFSFSMPDDDGGQAAWHTTRGWIFVECDHLGVGDSTVPGSGVLTIAKAAIANKVAVEAVLGMLETGGLHPGLGPVAHPIVLGMGQSMGGLVTIALQGVHRIFDGIAILGFSGMQTLLPQRPDVQEQVFPWLLRSSEGGAPIVTNGVSLESFALDPEARIGQMTYAYHDASEPADVIEYDMLGDPASPDRAIAPWRSPTVPEYAAYGVSPGVVATEAASITTPVLIAVGARDVVPNPLLEPIAYRSSPDISIYICPHMAHMHNFSPMRHAFWDRIHSWGETVAAQTAYRQP